MIILLPVRHFATSNGLCATIASPFAICLVLLLPLVLKLSFQYIIYLSGPYITHKSNYGPIATLSMVGRS